jgi:hypothetical protein
VEDSVFDKTFFRADTLQIVRTFGSPPLVVTCSANAAEASATVVGEIEVIVAGANFVI